MIANNKLIKGRENTMTISAVILPEKPISRQRLSTKEIDEKVVSIKPGQVKKTGSFIEKL